MFMVNMMMRKVIRKMVYDDTFGEACMEYELCILNEDDCYVQDEEE